MPRLKKRNRTKQLEPYWQTTDGDTVRLYQGDVIGVLDKLPPRSVQMCVTSPPYWGLRDYGTDKSLEIGSERTPEEFVEKMVQVFRSVRRVLRDDGILFLNLGDTYAHSGACGGESPDGPRKARETDRVRQEKVNRAYTVPSGSLVGVPWRVALALQADGWVLRQDIIWAKPSPMPESVRNRCTKAHEYVFMLSKGQDYFYDCEAVREPHSLSSVARASNPNNPRTLSKGAGVSEIGVKSLAYAVDKVVLNQYGANKRSVWTIASESYAGAHFATFPTKLVEPCILAGTSAYGACAQCGTPWERVVDRNRVATRPGENTKTDGKTPMEMGNRDPLRHTTDTNTVGWAQRCDCATEEVVPCVVLDPFVGSGTTCCVAIEHGRRSVGIDLSAKYLTENAIPRITGYLVDVPAKANLVAIRTDNGKGPAKRFRKGRQL